jgi:hypothetical protein
MQDQYQQMIDTKMCSDLCPCDNNMKKGWDGATPSSVYTPEVMASNFSRGPNPDYESLATEEEKLTYDGVVPFTWADNTASDPTRANWFECYNTTLKEKLNKTQETGASSTND